MYTYVHACMKICSTMCLIITLFSAVPDTIVESAINITLSVDPFNVLVTISQDVSF